MPRLLVDGEWYEPLAADAIYEAEYEALLRDRARDLYPDFLLVPFKRLIESPNGSGIPDLALVERRYRSWWVVEVELGVHPLESHVLRQVEVFSSAEYGQADADFLAEQEASFDRARLREMVRGNAPRVLVLVNDAKPTWNSWLARYDALVGVVQLFRARTGKLVLRVNGQHPASSAERLVTRCRRDSFLPRALIVESPGALALGDGGDIDVEFQGALTRWRQISVTNVVWLMPEKRDPLPPNEREFELVREGEGRLTLVASGHRRRLGDRT